eukprot:gb/GFBE01006956.1/.p1 GENE.gb/GFBE01006956.1/~~gb/GFBE01006956.1/.p1  ORF type:complete len:134 (+),score=29.67 gb/GFBE01006956.1/:1-402(+)
MALKLVLAAAAVVLGAQAAICENWSDNATCSSSSDGGCDCVWNGTACSKGKACGGGMGITNLKDTTTTVEVTTTTVEVTTTAVLNDTNNMSNATTTNAESNDTSPTAAISTACRGGVTGLATSMLMLCSVAAL